MAQVFERAVNISLEKKDPKKKLERRLERQRKQSADAEKPCPGKIPSKEEHAGGEEESQSHYVSSAVRERLFAHAAYQCEYIARDGTRCSARTGLEIEHEKPFAIYRSHDERYLRIFCKRHNRFHAEQIYGAEFIQTKIDEKKRSAGQPAPG